MPWWGRTIKIVNDWGVAAPKQSEFGCARISSVSTHTRWECTEGATKLWYKHGNFLQGAGIDHRTHERAPCPGPRSPRPRTIQFSLGCGGTRARSHPISKYILKSRFWETHRTPQHSTASFRGFETDALSCADRLEHALFERVTVSWASLTGPFGADLGVRTARQGAILDEIRRFKGCAPTTRTRYELCELWGPIRARAACLGTKTDT